jgi:2-polyprenyl-3-methyl-5-hydroxy-6-metoxy-1,4-benzoquinol methylase
MSQISDWWAKNPMTYGVEHGTSQYTDGDVMVRVDLGTREFFENADRELYAWHLPLHNADDPFGKIFPYKTYSGKQVLEVGCGMGGMAMLWAKRGARITACDLNPVAIEQTTRRFELFGLQGQIQQEDGNQLSFASESFDYVYSWGVLHHSPNLERSIAELFRVLKPGGGFGVMLYNRRSLTYLYSILYLEGFLHGELRFLNHLELASRYTDARSQEGNPHTWPVTRAEMRKLFSRFASDLKIDALMIPMHLLPGLRYVIPAAFDKAWGRRLGWFLWMHGRKR